MLRWIINLLRWCFVVILFPFGFLWGFICGIIIGIIKRFDATNGEAIEEYFFGLFTKK